MQTHIILDIPNNYYFLQSIQDQADVFMHNLVQCRFNRKCRLEGDMTNLFKRELIDVFKYVKIFSFKTDILYTISLLSLLSIIKNSSLNKIILELGAISVLHKVENVYIISSDLKERFNLAGYDISDLFCYDKHVRCVIDRQ